MRVNEGTVLLPLVSGALLSNFSFGQGIGGYLRANGDGRRYQTLQLCGVDHRRWLEDSHQSLVQRKNSITVLQRQGVGGQYLR